MKFNHANGLKRIARAHQLMQEGYQETHDKHVTTIFSAPNYCNEFNNSGAMMNINENLECCFQVLRPVEKVGAFKGGRPKTPIKRGGGL